MNKDSAAAHRRGDPTSVRGGRPVASDVRAPRLQDNRLASSIGPLCLAFPSPRFSRDHLIETTQSRPARIDELEDP